MGQEDASMYDSGTMTRGQCGLWDAVVVGLDMMSLSERVHDGNVAAPAVSRAVVLGMWCRGVSWWCRMGRGLLW